MRPLFLSLGLLRAGPGRASRPQNAGEGDSAPQLPVGQTFKNFEFPDLPGRQTEIHAQRRHGQGHHAQPRGDDRSQNRFLRKRQGRPRPSPRPRRTSTLPSKRCGRKTRCYRSRRHDGYGADLRLRPEDEEVSPAHQRESRAEAFRRRRPRPRPRRPIPNATPSQHPAPPPLPKPRAGTGTSSMLDSPGAYSADHQRRAVLPSTDAK